MKKRILIILVGLLLLANFVLAEEVNTTNQTENRIVENKTQLPNIRNLTQNFIAPQKLNDFLLKERTIPSKLGKIENTLLFTLGIDKQERLNLHFLAIFFVFLATIFLISYNLMKLIPSFSPSTYWTGAVVPTFLLSISKSINFLTEKTILLFQKITFLENFKIIEIILIATLLTIALNYLSLLIHTIKKKQDLEKARESGEKIGRQFAKMEVMDMFDSYKLDNGTQRLVPKGKNLRDFM